MRTLVNEKESSQYVLHLKNVFPKVRKENGTRLQESFFYDFAVQYKGTFSGYENTVRSRFVDEL